jgi:hypothetical protein
MIEPTKSKLALMTDIGKTWALNFIHAQSVNQRPIMFKPFPMRQIKVMLVGFLGYSLLVACADENSNFQAIHGSTNEELASLHARAMRVSDEQAIKRLQRSFGYYMEEALVEEVLALLSEDASIEYARDGVYQGKPRVQEYLYALNGGKSGLSQGKLQEYLQLMPVISVAADGLTAKARWRGIMLFGDMNKGEASWGEGPFENEYVKIDGIWKISKIHWYQTILVPFKGGWGHSEDLNQGIWVSDILPPDKPSTFDKGSWPTTFLPPFSFVNPVGRYDAELQQVPEVTRIQPELPSLETFQTTDLQSLQAIILTQHAHTKLENLQRIFGFYIDKQLWHQAADLFTKDATYEDSGSGVYVGREAILAYLQSLGAEGPQPNVLNDHMQLMPVIDLISATRARGRWHHFSQQALHGVSHSLGTGIYENEYVLEEGVWRIAKLHRYSSMVTNYDLGWGEQADRRSQVSTEFPPQHPPSLVYENYPEVFVPPFHYGNPGIALEDLPKFPEDLSLQELRKILEEIEDFRSVERLQTVYGYYLARNQWDDLTGLFAPDGTIEIAQRGVYIGQASVRRNLDLYGVQDELPGQLHNHMQYQPVIHISENGQHAFLRSRALSMMGAFGSDGRWMGGTYENVYVKRDGVWMILKDQQYNTYFASVDNGWKDLPWRPAPGINPNNPPDEPPSVYFEMYPRAFLPPFHYMNPVSGRQTSWTPNEPTAAE